VPIVEQARARFNRIAIESGARPELVAWDPFYGIQRQPRTTPQAPPARRGRPAARDERGHLPTL
jgi:hypothetical protein